MKQPIVVTNLRIPQADLIQAKIRASELNLSLNEYVLHIIRKSATNSMLGDLPIESPSTRRKAFINALLELSNTKGENTSDEASEEDKIIYDL